MLKSRMWCETLGSTRSWREQEEEATAEQEQDKFRVLFLCAFFLLGCHSKMEIFEQISP